MTNIFDLPSSLPNEELFESLVSTDNILIERIISTGQVTPPGEWYDQDKDEWLILLQGEASLAYADGSKIKLTAEDYQLLKIDKLWAASMSMKVFCNTLLPNPHTFSS